MSNFKRNEELIRNCSKRAINLNWKISVKWAQREWEQAKFWWGQGSVRNVNAGAFLGVAQKATPCGVGEIWIFLFFFYTYIYYMKD